MPDDDHTFLALPAGTLYAEKWKQKPCLELTNLRCAKSNTVQTLFCSDN